MDEQIAAAMRAVDQKYIDKQIKAVRRDFAARPRNSGDAPAGLQEIKESRADIRQKIQAIRSVQHRIAHFDLGERLNRSEHSYAGEVIKEFGVESLHDFKDSDHLVHLFGSNVITYSREACEIIPELRKASLLQMYNLTHNIREAAVFQRDEDDTISACRTKTKLQLLAQSPDKKRLISLLTRESDCDAVDQGPYQETIAIIEKALEQEAQKISGAPPATLEELLYREGTVKKIVYENDRESIANATALGVVYEPFLNLTDSSLVVAAVEHLRKDPMDAAYQTVLGELQRRGLSLKSMTEQDVAIFSDEISYAIAYAMHKKPSLQKRLPEFLEMFHATTINGAVSFRYATRSNEDRKLGKLCGDCTQEGSPNEEKVDSWILDSLYQQMGLSYEKRFMGRTNLTVVGHFRDPLLLVDAIEFIPQARKQPSYTQRAQEALGKGIEKIIEISDRMNIRSIAALSLSNSNEVAQELARLGFSQSKKYEISPLRAGPLETVVGLPQEIPYFLQTRENPFDGVTTAGAPEANYVGRTAQFEAILNQGVMADPQYGVALKELIRSEAYGEAAQIIFNYDLLSPTSSQEISSGLRWTPVEIEKGLKYLYSASQTSEMNVKLTTIRE